MRLNFLLGVICLLFAPTFLFIRRSDAEGPVDAGSVFMTIVGICMAVVFFVLDQRSLRK